MSSVGGISLFRSKKGGNIRARWGKGKTRVDFNTRTHDEKEALRLAAEELHRRAKGGFQTPDHAHPAAPHSPVQLPAGPSAPANGIPPGPRPLSDVFARVLIPPPAPGGASPSVASMPVPAAVVPDAVVKPPDPDAEQLAKVRHVHKVVAKSATHILEGLLKRSVRFAGREPEDMDDDEQALIQEGMQELAAEYLGTKKLTPTGKVLAGSICAGVGMYMGGTQIPKPAKVLELVPDQNPQPGGDGGKSA